MKIKLSKKELYKLTKKENLTIESYYKKKITITINSDSVILNELQITLPKKNIDNSQSLIMNFLYTIIHKNSFGWVTICQN